MGLGLKTCSEKGQLGGSNANVYSKYIDTPTLVSRFVCIIIYSYVYMNMSHSQHNHGWGVAGHETCQRMNKTRTHQFHTGRMEYGYVDDVCFK